MMKLISSTNNALRSLQYGAVKAPDLSGVCVLSRKIQKTTALFLANLTIADIIASCGQLLDRIVPLQAQRPEVQTQ